MSFQINNAVVNKVLCFVYTSRDALSTEDIVSTAVVYYSKEEIEQAKKFLVKLCAEKPIGRVSCASWPDPCVAHISDMIELIEKYEAKNFLFPKFVADSFDALPPMGSSKIAEVVRSLRDEMAAFRQELVELRKERATDIKALEDLNNVQNDIVDIKTIVTASSRNSQLNHAPTKMTMAQAVKANPASKNKAIPPVNPIARRLSTSPSAQSNPSGGPSTLLHKQYRRLPQRKNSSVLGTRKVSASAGLSSAPRSLDVFVSRCVPGTISDNIVAFCSNDGVVIEKCELLKTKITSCESFKVTVRASDRDKLLDPAFWPEGIVARKFFEAKNKASSARRGNSRSTSTSSA